MRKIILLTITVAFSILNAFSQDPSFTIKDTSRVYINSGENHIYISNPSDGGDGSQNLTFNAYSQNNEVASIIDIDYNQGDNVAVLKIEEKGLIDKT